MWAVYLHAMENRQANSKIVIIRQTNTESTMNNSQYLVICNAGEGIQIFYVNTRLFDLPNIFIPFSPR